MTTVGSLGRYRTRSRLTSQGLVHLGVQTTESKKDGSWVQTASTPVYGNIPIYRYYKFDEKCHDELHWPGPPYKHGGPLDLVRGTDGGLTQYPLSSGGWVYPSSVTRMKFEGRWMPNWYPPSPFTLRSTFNIDNVGLPDLSSYGPSAYAKYSPTKPAVDLGQFFAEFREIPKMLFDGAKLFRDLWRAKGGYSKTFGPKRVASEFLGYQFGWVPFLGTLLDFHRVMRTLDKRIKRIIKHNGIWEHRGGSVEDELISEELIYSATSPSKTYPSISSAFGNSGWVKIYKRQYRQIWFSGYFKYYIPEIKFRNWWQPEIMKMILGLRISPSLLWEVTPFSWLFDWFGNIGDILANAEDADIYNLVSRNAFLMAKSDIRFDFEAERWCGPRVHHAVWPYTFIRKQRVKASPYGFNVQWGDLSAKQIGILGALGVTFS